MSRLIQAVHLAAALLPAPFLTSAAFGAEPAAHIGRHDSTPEDIRAITEVTEQFQAALKTKDVKLLSTLVLNGNILFASPPAPDVIKHVNDKFDVNFDGLGSGGFTDFARFIGNSKTAVEEKFYNLKITQDGNVAWAMFDFEFVDEGKIRNHGVEMWQMMKSKDGKWKIASVYWSSKGAPK